MFRGNAVCDRAGPGVAPMTRWPHSWREGRCFDLSNLPPENGGARTPPLIALLVLAAEAATRLEGSKAHQHPSRADYRHGKAADEGADHRVGKDLQGHAEQFFRAARGCVPAPAKPSESKMPYRRVLCGARGHVAPRNYLADVQR